MNISELIEVAIGLVFVYLTVSLACSQLQEVLARTLSWRAKDLEVTIRNMLNNPPRTQARGIVKDWYDRTFHWNIHQKGQNATTFVDALYAHPLIASLIKRNQSLNIGPEQIPARTFALALFDLVMTAGTDTSLIRQQLEQLKQFGQPATGLSPEQQQALDQELQRLASAAAELAAASELAPVVSAAAEQAAEQAAASVLERVAQLRNDYADFALKYPFVPAARQILQAALPAVGPVVIDQFRRGVMRLGNKYPGLDLKRRLDGLLIGVSVEALKEEAAIAAARLNAESWFDDTMTRATVWYKTNVQKILLALGIVFAVALNIDSVAIANTLWREPTLRQAVADQARAAIAPSPASTPIPAGDLGTIISTTNASLVSLRLPVGWMPCGTSPKTACLNGAEVPADTLGWLTKLAGFALTGLAAMQGGPFWFEILSKLISIGETTKKEQAVKEVPK